MRMRQHNLPDGRLVMGVTVVVLIVSFFLHDQLNQLLLQFLAGCAIGLFLFIQLIEIYGELPAHIPVGKREKLFLINREKTETGTSFDATMVLWVIAVLLTEALGRSPIGNTPIITISWGVTAFWFVDWITGVGERTRKIQDSERTDAVEQQNKFLRKLGWPCIYWGLSLAATYFVANLLIKDPVMNWIGMACVILAGVGFLLLSVQVKTTGDEQELTCTWWVVVIEDRSYSRARAWLTTGLIGIMLYYVGLKASLEPVLYISGAMGLATMAINLFWLRETLPALKSVHLKEQANNKNQ